MVKTSIARIIPGSLPVAVCIHGDWAPLARVQQRERAPRLLREDAGRLHLPLPVGTGVGERP